jgi:hypothetical protein
MHALQDCWVYEEDISIDFAFAQSVLFKIYGNVLQETGHLTMGHICLTRNDKATAVDKKGNESARWIQYMGISRQCWH